MNALLSDEDRANVLAECLNNGWTLQEDRDAITKSFRFGNFCLLYTSDAADE